MLVRVNGGNSGVMEYLVTGIKNGRDHARDELDKRVILAGDMTLTNSIINSIPDKGQDRYLHITLSFRESDIENDDLKKICDDYIDMTFSNYDRDELNFYAEAHLPKIKKIRDRKTGEMVERKPHIHIVVPRLNLVSGNKLNPFSNYLKDVKYFQAIQEKINIKYNLESPQDFKRNSIDHYPEILSRIKGDLFNEKNSKVKLNLFEKIVSNEINSIKEFESELSKMGKFVIRNAGKDSEYYAVKLKDEKKFINLKNPVFSKKFISGEEITLPKMTEKEINKNVTMWQKTISREIKFIRDANPKLRAVYFNSHAKEKEVILCEREQQYNERFGRSGNNQSSINKFKGRNFANHSNGLPEMRECTLVYGIDGYEQTERWRESDPNETNMLLSNNESRHLADEREEQHANSSLRWFVQNGERGRVDSEVEQISTDFINNQEQKQNNDLDKFKEIRLNLKGDFFLNYLKDKYNINPDEYRYKYVKDGSVRINVGKLNLNPSDFLTKHLNLEWNDAKNVLEDCYLKQNEQKLLTPSLKIKNWPKFNKEYNQPYYDAISDAVKNINNLIRTLKNDSIADYKNKKNLIYSQFKNQKERRGALSICLFEKLKNESMIKEYRSDLFKQLNAMKNRSEIENYIHYLQKTGQFENITQNIKEYFNKENTIIKNWPVFELRQHIDEIKAFKSNLHENSSEYLVDKHDKFIVTNLDKKTITNAVATAIIKYGNNINLTGSDEFKTKFINECVKQKISTITFSDDNLNNKYRDLINNKNKVFVDDFEM